MPQSSATIASGAYLEPMVVQPFEVTRYRNETPDTFTIRIRPQADDAETGFTPGQFNMLYAFGVGEVPISISGDPSKAGEYTHTIRSVGAVTRALGSLRKESILGVRGPYGTAWPVTEAEGNDVVIIAGGIGLAPLRPVVYHILKHRKKYGAVSLLVGTRTPDDILYRSELERWRSRLDMEVHVTVDRAPIDWRGNVGVVTKLIDRVDIQAPDTLAMVCGPEVMMRHTALKLQERALNQDQIYVSMERNMQCGIGLCGHCQCGAYFACKDGPVFRFDEVRKLFIIREI